MKMYFYRGEVPNFGDELNHLVLPRIFPNFFDEDDSTLFLGIGSILFDHHPQQALKIVFGSGFGGYTNLPRLDERWRIFCVRGPRTARALGLDPSLVAADSAILIHDLRPRPVERGSVTSFMPHFQSIYRGHWQMACRLAGIHFIDPRRSVEQVLNEIETSKVVISEAMHGVIVSDALRVPWIPILPFDPGNRMKWDDWSEALDMKLTFQRVAPSSGREAYLSIFDDPYRHRKLIRQMTKLGLTLLDAGFVVAAAHGLKRAARRDPVLSADASFDRALDRLKTAAVAISKAF